MVIELSAPSFPELLQHAVDAFVAEHHRYPSNAEIAAWGKALPLSSPKNPGVVGASSPSSLMFTVYGEPQPRGSKTAGVTKKGQRFYRDSNPKSYPWMSEVTKAAAKAMNGRALFTGPLRIDLDFYLARPLGHFGAGRNAKNVKPSAPARPITKPDVGKLARGTVDAMEGTVFRQDAQQVEGDARKFYGSPIRCEIRITEL